MGRELNMRYSVTMPQENGIKTIPSTSYPFSMAYPARCSSAAATLKSVTSNRDPACFLALSQNSRSGAVSPTKYAPNSIKHTHQLLIDLLRDPPVQSATVNEKLRGDGNPSSCSPKRYSMRFASFRVNATDGTDARNIEESICVAV